MLCCGISALVAASAALSGKRAAKRSRLAPAFMLAALALSAFAATHFGHYVERAQANERTLLAEMMAQPICTGAPDRQVRNIDQPS